MKNFEGSVLSGRKRIGLVAILCIIIIISLFLFSGCGARKVSLNKQSIKTEEEIRRSEKFTSSEKDSSAKESFKTETKTERSVDSSKANSTVKRIESRSDSTTLVLTGDNITIDEKGSYTGVKSATIKKQSQSKKESDSTDSKQNAIIRDLKAESTEKTKELTLKIANLQQTIEEQNKKISEMNSKIRESDRKAVPWYTYVIVLVVVSLLGYGIWKYKSKLF